MSKTKSRLLGILFIIIFIACVFGTLTPIAKAQRPREPGQVVQQTPVQDEYDADMQMNPNAEQQYDVQSDTDNQYDNYSQPGVNQDTGTQYDDDINAQMEPELMTQQESNAQSVVLWILVALGFVVIAVLITISIMRNRDRSTTR